MQSRRRPLYIQRRSHRCRCLCVVIGARKGEGGGGIAVHACRLIGNLGSGWVHIQNPMPRCCWRCRKSVAIDAVFSPTSTGLVTTPVMVMTPPLAGT